MDTKVMYPHTFIVYPILTHLFSVYPILSPLFIVCAPGSIADSESMNRPLSNIDRLFIVHIVYSLTTNLTAYSSPNHRLFVICRSWVLRFDVWNFKMTSR
jgi:hypothetical protein